MHDFHDARRVEILDQLDVCGVRARSAGPSPLPRSGRMNVPPRAYLDSRTRHPQKRAIRRPFRAIATRQGAAQAERGETSAS
jgi:hypothetical protein